MYPAAREFRYIRARASANVRVQMCPREREMNEDQFSKRSQHVIKQRQTSGGKGGGEDVIRLRRIDLSAKSQAVFREIGSNDF